MDPFHGLPPLDTLSMTELRGLTDAMLRRPRCRLTRVASYLDRMADFRRLAVEDAKRHAAPPRP